MLSPYQPKNVKLLIGFFVFLGFEPITLTYMGKGGGGFPSSNFPNHDAKGWKGKTKTENIEKKQKTKGKLH